MVRKASNLQRNRSLFQFRTSHVVLTLHISQANTASGRVSSQINSYFERDQKQIMLCQERIVMFIAVDHADD
jgi:hypothetical protein